MAAAYPNFSRFLNEEHPDALAAAGNITVGDYIIFGTKYNTIPGAGVAPGATNIITTDAAGAAAASPAAGVWGKLNLDNTLTRINLDAAGTMANFRASYPYPTSFISDNQITSGLALINRDAETVNVIVGRKPTAAGLADIAQLALPDFAANAAAKDLIDDISSPAFTNKVTIYLNQKSICCKTFYDFICKITDIIYNKKNINIWHTDGPAPNKLVVANGVKVGAMADLKCDGVALTCKNGLSTAKHSVFTEELSYMYSEVMRLTMNHANMLNSGFMLTAIVGAGGPTPLETALNKFKNFLAVLLRYDYLIKGDTTTRKNRFKTQAADALYRGVNYMAPRGANPPPAFNDAFMNYLYDTHDNIGGAGIGFADFFTHIGAQGNPFSFFPADVQSEIVSALIEKGNLTTDLRGPGLPVAPNTLVGIVGPGCRNLFNNALIQPAAANAGGDITQVAGVIPANKYHLYFDYTNAAGAQAAGANAFPVAASLLNDYINDMSVAGSEEEIHWTCGRIADPIGRYGIGFNAGGNPQAAPAIDAGATGLTYKQFILMLLTQLMAHYDSIVAADKPAVAPIARAAPAPSDADSLLKRTYYMTAYPAYFATANIATAAAPARAQPALAGGLIPQANSTPIVQSIVRYVKSCLQ